MFPSLYLLAGIIFHPLPRHEESPIIESSHDVSSAEERLKTDRNVFHFLPEGLQDLLPRPSSSIVLSYSLFTSASRFLTDDAYRDRYIGGPRLPFKLQARETLLIEHGKSRQQHCFMARYSNIRYPQLPLPSLF